MAFISKWSLSQPETSKSVVEKPFRGQLQPLHRKRPHKSHFDNFSLPYLIAQRDRESLKQAVEYHQNLHDYAKFDHGSSSSYGSVSSSKESMYFSETELLTNHDSPLCAKTPDTNKIAEITKTLTNDRRNWTKFHLKCIGSNAN